MFTLHRVTVRFPGAVALSDVSLQVPTGEVVGLVGSSGAGKTTLLRLLNGSLRPSEGRVEADGKSLGTIDDSELRSLRSRVGFIHQRHDLVPNLRVSQNVLLGRLGRTGWIGGLRAVFWPRQDSLREVHEVLGRVGIGDKLFQRTDRLSGGEQQRVAIARALHQEPKALLADEPVASVDPGRAKEVIHLLVELARERGVSLVVSLHDLPLARTLPRLIGLRAGKVVFDKPTSELDDEAFHSLYENGG